MKPIQVMFDEDLLAELDADPGVRDKGRSAVLRQAAVEYLDRRRDEAIAREYQCAYGSTEDRNDEFEGWEDEGVWPNL